MFTPLDRVAVGFVAARMRDPDRDEIFATRWDDDPEKIADETIACARFGCVAWHGGEPAAVVCAMPLWPGVWTVAMYATTSWPAVAPAVTRWIRRQLMPDIVATGAHRAECRSLATHVMAHRWLERLGARREALLTDYGRNREAYYVYAWTLTDLTLADLPGDLRCASTVPHRRLHPRRRAPTARRSRRRPPPSASGCAAPAAAPPPS
ncbi:MAG TPA: hypothetical protein VL966_06930 [Alphaproteobacteria bacterium]|jgi:hypothetical protein|nr:hypothetical protein [Alphaproteobacteria bacterium]